MVYTAFSPLPSKEKENSYYFLAGSIDFKESNPWRESFYKNSNEFIHFFDPTRPDHYLLNDEEMRQHINWELDALELADKIFLNFLSEAKSPISLVELGLYSKSAKLVVICPYDFYQYRYVETLCEKYDIPLFQKLEKVKFYFA